MSYERCFAGFAGHNVDRWLWADTAPTVVASATPANDVKRTFRSRPWTQQLEGKPPFA